MDKELGKDVPQESRAKFLHDNCDGVEERPYMRRLTPEELTARKDSLSGLAIEINDIDEEKKEVLAEIKERQKPLKKQMRHTLKEIKDKAVLVEGEEIYKFVYKEERMVGYYNQDGDLIDARPAGIDELQGTIMQVIRTGTSD